VLALAELVKLPEDVLDVLLVGMKDHGELPFLVAECYQQLEELWDYVVGALLKQVVQLRRLVRELLLLRLHLPLRVRLVTLSERLSPAVPRLRASGG